jgi:hypothetical protein
VILEDGESSIEGLVEEKDEDLQVQVRFILSTCLLDREVMVHLTQDETMNLK